MSTTANLIQLTQAIAATSLQTPTDTDLLQLYSTRRDETAFAELVRRNGPVVLRTCRHFLGHASADDAFQVTFVLLARSAQRFKQPGSLVGWLHAAAVRISLRVQREERRRKRREAAHAYKSPAADELTWREVREILDHEIASLPEKYRLPIILCSLQELSYQEAARRAGCSVGALRGRLERAKDELRKRLARRGLPIAAPVLIVATPETISATLINSTTKLVSSMESGHLPHKVAHLLAPTIRIRSALLAATTIVLAAIGLVLPGADALPKHQQKKDQLQPAASVANETQARADLLGDPLPEGAVARLGTRRFCGPSDSDWAGFSPDGTKIASINGRMLAVFDSATGQQLVARYDYCVARTAVGWRPDGVGVAIARLHDWTFFVSAFTDPNEILPNPPYTNPPANRNRWPDGLEFLALSPDARQLAIVRDPDEKQFTIDLVPATPGQAVAQLKPVKTLGPFPGPCREVRYTPRGVLVLTGSWNEENDWAITVVNPEKNTTVSTVHIPPPAYGYWGFMFSLSLDARLAAIPMRPKEERKGENAIHRHDGTIHIWDLEAGKEIHTVSFAKRDYTGHAFTPDGKKLIITGEDPYFQVVDVQTGKTIAQSSFREYYRASLVAVSPDGKRFITSRRDGRIDLWETDSAKRLSELNTHRDGLTAVAMSPSGKLVATLGDDNTVRVWELGTGKPVSTITVSDSNSQYGFAKHQIAFTADEHGLLFTSKQAPAMADPMTGKPIDLRGELQKSKGRFGDLSRDGKTLVTFDGGRVAVWDWPEGTKRVAFDVPLATPKPPLAYEGQEAVRVRSTHFSPDGQLLFTNSIREAKDQPQKGGMQNANDTWDVRSGKRLFGLNAPETWYPPVSFSPDARILYLGGHSLDAARENGDRKQSDALTARDAATGKLLREFTDPDKPSRARYGALGTSRQVQALALSPDGRLLAASEGPLSSSAVWIYETITGREFKKFQGHDRNVVDLAFSADGRRLVSVSEDQTGLVWDVTLNGLAGGKIDKPSQKDLLQAWERLAVLDPAQGYLGIATLVNHPADGIKLFREKLRHAITLTEAEMDRVIAELGADEFADRGKAQAELERCGLNGVVQVKARLKGISSPEVRNYVTRFLARYDGPYPTPYDVRSVRGVAALEAMDQPEARELLTELAKGKAEDILTREASAANKRLGRR